jgi:hypothetical protein
MTRYPAYKVAAAHVAPVFLDTDRSVEKAWAKNGRQFSE